MARAKTLTTALLVFLLFLSPPATPPPCAAAIQIGQWPALLSLSRSLMSRVANARAARGDRYGAERARKIAANLRLFGRGGASFVITATWDFVWNYGWRGGIGFREAFEVSGAAAELLAALGEAARLDSVTERAAWTVQNRSRLISKANKLFRALLRTFSRSGPLREAVLAIQKEVVDGELLKDCLEVGAGDLEGVVRIAKQMFSSRIDRDEEL